MAAESLINLIVKCVLPEKRKQNLRQVVYKEGLFYEKGTLTSTTKFSVNLFRKCHDIRLTTHCGSTYTHAAW